MLMLAVAAILVIWWAYLLLSQGGRHARRTPAWVLFLMVLTAAVFVFFGAGMTWGK